MTLTRPRLFGGYTSKVAPTLLSSRCLCLSAKDLFCKEEFVIPNIKAVSLLVQLMVRLAPEGHGDCFGVCSIHSQFEVSFTKERAALYKVFFVSFSLLCFCFCFLFFFLS